MGAERRAALDALLDKQAIREALEAFSRGMDRFDRAAFLSAFWPDAEIAAGPFVGSAQTAGTGPWHCTRKGRS